MRHPLLSLAALGTALAGPAAPAYTATCTSTSAARTWRFPCSAAHYPSSPAATTADGPVVVAGDADGCAASALPPAAAPGSVLVVVRGNCAFGDKGAAAEAAGYAGLVIVDVNDESQEAPPPPSLGKRAVQIPVVSVAGPAVEALAAPGATAALVLASFGATDAATAYADGERLRQDGYTAEAADA